MIYFYKWVKLPKLPEVDTTTFPNDVYTLICGRSVDDTTNEYVAWMLNGMPRYSDDKIKFPILNTVYENYTCQVSNGVIGEWVKTNEGIHQPSDDYICLMQDDGVHGINYHLIYTDFDVTDNGTVIFEASEPEFAGYCLTFSSAEPFIIETASDSKTWDGTLYYSTDTKRWTEWDGTIAAVSAEHSGEYRIYMCGKGNTVITGTEAYRNWQLIGSQGNKVIHCNGNIETLLDYATVASRKHPAMADNCFDSLFLNCARLATAPEMPATELTESCYFMAFANCTNLETVPQLPAVTLAKNCYAYMFEGCTGIKFSATQSEEYPNEYRIPAIETGTTAENALSQMFRSTGGTFTGTPEINTTYFTSNTIIEVKPEEPDVPDEPDEPDEPDTPVDPDVPVDPEEPEQPNVFTNYYNGFYLPQWNDLPVMPEWDQAKFPYLLLTRLRRSGVIQYVLRFLDKEPFVEDARLCPTIPTTYATYTCYDSTEGIIAGWEKAAEGVDTEGNVYYCDLVDSNLPSVQQHLVATNFDVDFEEPDNPDVPAETVQGEQFGVYVNGKWHVFGGLPPVTEADTDKVLTANADGTSSWKDPKGNANFIFADSEEELPDPSTVPEDTVALVPSKGDSGTPIHYYDSLEAVPADLPEGSFVAVPAEENAGGGGLPVVEITTLPTEEGALLTEEEVAKMNALNGGMCVLKVNYVQDDVAYPVTAYPSITDNGGILLYICIMVNWYIILTKYEGNWSIAQMPMVG